MCLPSGKSVFCRSVRVKGATISDLARSDTRGALLAAAKRLFAERGFYGASIAAIAAELGLTKQALIHHFGSKERLYGDVLAQLAGQLTGLVSTSQAREGPPAKQFEELIARLLANTLDFPNDTQLTMRELLDNKARAKHAQNWPMREFLAALAAMIRKAAPHLKLSETEAIGRVYALLGAVNFYAVSQPTLRHMYGKQGYEALRTAFPQEIRRLARAALAP